MLEKGPYVHVKAITDYHLMEFLKCPYKFYNQMINYYNGTTYDWRQIVQYSVNRIIREYYQQPFSSQTPLHILKLVQHHWQRVDVIDFDSKVHYYMVLAKITDHLLRHLPTSEMKKPPLFLYEKFNTYVEEFETNLSLTFEVAEWSSKSFSVKKFLTETNEEIVKLFKYLTVVLSQKAFDQLPEKIEIVSLIEGVSYMLYPNRKDYLEGLSYLEQMKSIIERPEYYSKTEHPGECRYCPYRLKCDGEDPKKESNHQRLLM
jgi:CRISPR/Cas system-associated exonuclease Cas4 (RecB family)